MSAPVPAGVCPACKVEKTWLRPGETCAPCRVPKGPVRLVVDEEEIEPMAKKTRTATCETCGESFTCSPFGRVPAECKACKRGEGRPVIDADEDQGEAEDQAGEVSHLATATITAPTKVDLQGGVSHRRARATEAAVRPERVSLQAVAALAEAAGLDPVELLLVAIVDAHRAARASS